MYIKELYKIYNNSKGISIDTRNIKERSIFFGLKGDNFNGSKFAKIAIEKGAKIAIVDDKRYIGENIFYVKNSLKTLQKLALEHRKNISIPVIGITGTNGKTTSKEIISKVLSLKYKVFKTQGNFNNHIGVPLSILSIEKNTEIAVIEMGASKKGDIEELCKIALPSFGYITNFGKAHLEEFKSLENIINTKTELYNFIKKEKGILFVNYDDSIQIEKSKGIKQFSFGEEKRNDISCNLISASPFLKLNIEGNIFETKIVGEYNFYNIVSAFSIGRYFNIPIEKIISVLNNYILENNRTQIIKKGNNFIIMDCYNANPTSMKSSIDNFNKNIKSNKKCLILGDMLELGEASKNEHLDIINYIKTLKIDKIILIGCEFYKVNKTNLEAYKSFEKFISNFKLEKNTSYLIKGSRGIKLERIINYF